MMSRRLAVAALACSCAIPLSAQEAPTSQPEKRATFRSTVDLLTVDVNAVDKDGQPVRGLTPDQFAVEIGGKRRTVVRADFIDFASGRTGAADATDVTSNQTDTAAPEPRAILLLIDDESFAPAEGKPVFSRLAQLIDTLFPNDPLGFALLSGRGPAIEFTTDRKVIAERLRTLVGQKPSGPSLFGELSISEAYDIQHGDAIALRSVVERQCPGAKEQALQMCRHDVQIDAAKLAEETDLQTGHVLNAIQRHINGLAGLPGTKYVLLVSEGFVLDRSPASALNLGKSAARAGVRLHALQVDESLVDAARARSLAVAQNDSALRLQGLDVAASAAGGSVHRVVADPAGAFERIRREMAAVYRLGIESDPTDVGGERTIAVKCTRGDVTVQSHRQVIVPEKRSAGAVQERLARALQSPGIERGLALRLATFAYRGEKDAAQIVASVETDADPAGLHIGYAVRDRQGKAISAAELGRESIVLEKDAPPLIVFRTSVSPGEYEVKIAAIDGDGRVGTVVRSVSVEAPTSGTNASGPAGIALSDLLVLPPGGEIARMRPSARIAQGSRDASVYFEVYASAAPQTDVPVVLEITDSPEGPALGRTKTSVSLKYAGSPPRAGARVSFSPAALPPGHYFARLSIEGSTAKSVRGFNITTGGAAALLADEARVLVPPFTVDRFLSPELMRALSGRLSQYAQANESAQSAARSLVDGSWRSVTDKTGEPVIDATVAGLQALSAGRPGDAEKSFRDALDQDPEFTIALTLAGAAWAAVGRDVEAARAWRTSLATGVEAAFIYPEVASALLRQGDVKGLDEFVREIGDPGAAAAPLAREAAIAAAISGDRRRAVKALSPWVDAHPEDQDAAFLLLLALYELKFFEKDAGAAADLQLRAKAYIEAGGPRRTLVARWIK